MSTSSKVQLDSIRLELATLAAEVRVLGDRVQSLSSLLDTWAEQEGLLTEPEWDIIEDERPPFHFDEGETYPGAGSVRAGDPEPQVPSCVLELRRSRLKSASVPLEPRVSRAFHCGHRAWSAIVQNTEYRPAGAVVHLPSAY